MKKGDTVTVSDTKESLFLLILLAMKLLTKKYILRNLSDNLHDFEMDYK